MDIEILRAALSGLLADVESICCDPNAYGMPVTDPDHPFHASVISARAALDTMRLKPNRAGVNPEIV